jgi:Uma2 family endonuclease
MSAIPKMRLTAEEYLAIERKAETRSEFFAGEMFAMSGASREHNLIASNLNREIGEQLKDRPCEVYTTDMRVRIPSGLYTYPDVVVVCGDPKFEDDSVDTLLNPLVLIEVLSESTADYDRGTKFKHYRQISSLREYVLVDQTSAQIEHFTLGNDGAWKLTETKGLDATLILDSIGCRVPLSEVYRKVKFLDEGTTGVA